MERKLLLILLLCLFTAVAVFGAGCSGSGDATTDDGRGNPNPTDDDDIVGDDDDSTSDDDDDDDDDDITDTDDDDDDDDDTVDDDDDDDDTVDDDDDDDDTVDDDDDDDDTVDDDDDDDDTVDDDDDDDDTVDDDDDDDDTVDDDDDDDDTGDDDDDDDDDDSSGPGPWVSIALPEEDQDYGSFDVYLDADMWNVAVPDVEVLLDGEDIGGLVVITPTKVTGWLMIEGGQHTITINVENGFGTSSDTVHFTVSPPFIQVLTPEDGGTIYNPEVYISGIYGGVDPADVTLCERITATRCDDLTGQFTINPGTFEATIRFPFGAHSIEAVGTYPGGSFVRDYCVFWLEGGEPHIELHLSETEIGVGDTVYATFDVWDEDGNNITDLVTVDLDVFPKNGVGINGYDLTFVESGIFEVEVFTQWGSFQPTDVDWVFVDVAMADDIEINLAAYQVGAGSQVLAEATVYDPQGLSIYADVVWEADPQFGVDFSVNGQGTETTVTFLRVGSVDVTGCVVDTNICDTKTVDVTAGLPDSIRILLVDPLVRPGSIVFPVVEIRDALGNLTNADYEFIVLPTNGVTINQVAKSIQFDEEGTFIILARVIGFPSLYDSTAILVFDFTPPGIVFTYPPRGFFTQSSSVAVEGYITNCSQTDLLYIQGNPVSFNASCEFATSTSLEVGLNVIQGRLTEGGGSLIDLGSTSVLMGDYVANNAFAEDSVYIGITDKGFDKIQNLVLAYVNTLNIPGIIYSMNPIFNLEQEFWGIEWHSARGDVKNISLGGRVLNFEVRTGSKLYTYARQDNIDLDFKIKGHIFGIPYSISSDVTATNVALSATANLSAANERFYVSLSGINVSIAGLNVNVGGLAGIIIDLFFDSIWNAVRGLVESAIADVIADEIPGLLEDVLTELELAAEFDLDLPEGGGLLTISMEAVPATVSSNITAFTLGFDGRFKADRVSGLPPAMDGSLKTDFGTPPAFARWVPGTAQTYELGAYLGDELINQALYVLFRAGALSFDMDTGLNTADPIFNLIPEIRNVHGNAPVLAQFRPTLPPVILFDSAKSITSQVQIGDFMIHLAVDVPGSDPVLVLTLAAAADIPAVIDITYPDNTLDVTLGTPVATVDLVAEPVVDFPDSAFEVLAPLLIRLFLPFIEDLFSGIQIPTFEGFGIQVIDMFAVGPGNDYLSIWGDLVTP
jgi:hypothetical protein